MMAAEPVYATIVGDGRFDDRLAPNDPAEVDATIAADRARLERAREIAAGPLDGADRVTASALVAFLEAGIDMRASRVAAWTMDPLDGPQVDFLNLESFQPADTPAAREALLARWAAMGPWLDRQVLVGRDALAQGKVSPRSPTIRVLDQLDSLLARPDEDWPLSAPGRAEHPGMAATQRAAFAEDVLATVRDVVRPAFARFRAFVADEVLPAARPDERPGLSHVPGGSEAYARLARCPHVARARTRGDPRDRARGGRPDRRRARGAGGARPGDANARRCPRAPARRPGAPLLHARGGRRGRAPLAGAGSRGDRRLVRRAAQGALRRRRDARARGRALHRRVLPGPGARRLATRPLLHQHLQARDASALRGGGPGVPRVGARAPPPDRHRPGDRGPAGIPADGRLDCLHRGLGAVHRAALGRDGALHRRPRPDRDPLVRRLAGLPPGRGLGDARARLDALAGHRLHGRAHGPRAEQRRPTRSTATSRCPARRSPTSSGSSSCCDSARPRGSGSGPGSTSAASTTRS